MGENKKVLIVVAGPTAVGKTDLCVDLARHFDTEIVSADSRQFYIEMEIGTAKPTKEEMGGVKHHFVNTLHVSEEFNAMDFEKDALIVLEEIFSRKEVVIATGGSGMYIQALCEGMDDIPQVPKEVRDELNEKLEKEGIEVIRQQLEALDPDYYSQVDIQNPQRLVRALEVCVFTGKPFSSFRKNAKVNRPFDIIKIGLERDREELYERINRRMDIMIDQGLFEEAERLYPYRGLNALQTVGYKEIFDFLEEEYDKEEAIRLLKRNSRRYAKRQLTWFKRDEEMTWFHPGDKNKIISYLEQKVKG